jgi:VCBS repeat-containing protein
MLHGRKKHIWMWKALVIGMVVVGLASSVNSSTARSATTDPCAGGTLGYWPMNEGAGNVVYDVCNGFNGTFSQGVAWGADAEGPYLQFSPGDGPRVEVNAPSLSRNTKLTVELRMQAVGPPFTETRVISQQLRPDGTRGALRWLLKLEGRQLEVWGATGSNGFPDPPFFGFPGGTNRWVHVAFQIDGNRVWLYYDGVLRASGTLSYPQTLRALDAITEFGTGERIAGFAGKIQYVRISSGIRNDFLLTRPPENQPPTADANGPYSVAEGGSVILDGSGSSDPDDDPMTFAWDLDNNGTFETSGQNPTFTAASRDGPDSQTVVLQVCDTSDACDTDTATITINNEAPTATFGDDSPVGEGSSFSLSLTSPFDPSNADTSAGFEYAFDCGDGSGYGAVGSSNSATCVTDDDGARAVKGKIRDKDGGETEYTASVTVNNEAPDVTAPADQTADEATVATFTLGSFADPGDDAPWLVMVDWGDLSSDTFTVATPGALGSLPHTYADDGSYTVRVTVSEENGTEESGSVSFQVTVANLAPTAGDDTDTVSEDGPAVTLDVLANDSDPAGAADPLTITGVDTTGTTGSVIFTIGDVTYDPNGQFEALAAGEMATDAFGYTIGDGDGDTASATVIMTINGQNDVPSVVTDKETVLVDEGQVAANSGTFADVDSSDNVTISASVGTITQDAGNSGSWSWSLGTTDGPGESQTLTITANDGNGGLTTTTFELMVRNVAPTVGAITAPVTPVNLYDQPISASAPFTDPGTADTHDAVWDWGDNTTTTQSAVASPATASHTYVEPGVYRITLTITDDDGGLGQSIYEFVVTYNSDAGFVTGAGWIWSEAGWCQFDDVCAGAEGNARFGFVSKYNKGATIPTGNTGFQFKAGGLNFHSDEYDWLVVNQGGTNAQYKGLGAINGEQAPNGEAYKFMLWAKDDAPGLGDTFRIKIWWEGIDSSENVVYDNGFDQPIGGGNIRIHSGE